MHPVISYNDKAKRRRLAIRFSALLAICFESFMKYYSALRYIPIK